MAQIAVVVQGAQFTISEDATVRTDQGSVLGSDLKEYVRQNRQGWVEFGTMAEFDSDADWQQNRQSKCVAWVSCLWVGCVVEEAEGE